MLLSNTSNKVLNILTFICTFDVLMRHDFYIVSLLRDTFIILVELLCVCGSNL